MGGGGWAKMRFDSEVRGVSEPRTRTRVAPAPLPRPVADIDITRRHALGADGARHAAASVAERLRADFGVRSWWDGPTLRVAGRGVDGRLDAGADTVRVVARLGLFARPFAGSLRREIERELDRVTAVASPSS